MDLKKRSIQIIKENQASNGAYVACPNFENYKFCWLRDGSFIAYTMDLVGEYESAEKYFHWVNNTIKRYRYKVDTLLAKKQNGEIIEQSEYLPTRYTIDGVETNDNWTNFQLDGYGAWLWAFTEHLKLTGKNQLPLEFNESIEVTIAYLANFWDVPNYDCWEEHGDKIHTATIACIYAGLASINIYLNKPGIEDLLNEIKKFVNEKCVINNKLTKYVGVSNTDASLLWACVPFNLLYHDNEIIKNTVKDIEAQLLHKGGVHRYLEDTYYGGGEWLLLSSWLGWYYCKAGRIEEALQMLKWVENQSDEDGNMTEQVTYHPNDSTYIQKWIDRWGLVAKPLLWSHAMYLVLLTEIEKRGMQLVG